jgi:hypothetical protein
MKPIQTGYDTVLLMREEDTHLPRFVFCARDWRQSLDMQARLAKEGHGIALEEVFTGSIADCHAEVERQAASYRLNPVKVAVPAKPRAAGSPKRGREVRHLVTGAVYPSLAEACRKLNLAPLKAWRAATGYHTNPPIPIAFL